MKTSLLFLEMFSFFTIHLIVLDIEVNFLVEL